MALFYRTRIEKLIRAALEIFYEKSNVKGEIPKEIRIEYPPNMAFGDYSTPLAMELAKVFKMNPRKIAEDLILLIQDQISKSSDDFIISNIKMDGPGFINFFIDNNAFISYFDMDWNIHDYLKENLDNEKEKDVINIEFVSANPTGPLNIVSSRAAVLGDTIARIFSINGYSVRREYYVNDFGNQIHLLGRTFIYRYAQRCKVEIDLPEDYYRGDYIQSYLEELLDSKLLSSEVLPSEKEIQSIFSDNKRREEYLSKAAEEFGKYGLELILRDQKKDLESFGVSFDYFFSERSLHESGKVNGALEYLRKNNEIYESQGAIYFRASAYGDDKDRVLMRSDGRPTYFLADIAYHIDKINRGANRLYDIWGPDHHGYIPRLTGALQASGILNEKNTFSVLIAQQVNLIENGKQIEMSKRLGKFQTMKDLYQSIPLDAARYFFLMRAASTPLDFDLDLAKEKSNKNPVYYIQYAHARIHSIFRETKEKVDKNNYYFDERFLNAPTRKKLLLNISRFGELLEDISQNLEVHRLAAFLYDMASDFTTFYHNKDNRILEILEKNTEEGKVLLLLLDRVRIVIAEGLEILGITAPEKM